MPKFTFEDHEKKMREILKPKPQEGQRQNVLQTLLDRVRKKTKPGEGRPQI